MAAIKAARHRRAGCAVVLAGLADRANGRAGSRIWLAGGPATWPPGPPAPRASPGPRGSAEMIYLAGRA
jgi:hypothetical protein